MVVKKVTQTLKEKGGNMTTSAIVTAALFSLLSAGAYQKADEYIYERIDGRLIEHSSDAGHLSPFLIESISYLAEEDLSNSIDELMRAQCNGADLSQEIREKRKRYRKITGETYPNKTCDQLLADT